MSKSSSHRRTDKSNTKGASGSDYASAKVDSHNAPVITIKPDESPTASRTSVDLANAAPSVASGSTMASAGTSGAVSAVDKVSAIDVAANELRGLGSFPTSQILFLVAGVAVALCAIVSQFVIWSRSADTDEAIQKAVDAAVQASSADTQKLLSTMQGEQSSKLEALPEEVSKAVAPQLPIIGNALDKAEKTAASLRDLINSSEQTVKALGDQSDRDAALRDSLELRARTDQLEDEVKQTRRYLTLLNQNTSQLQTATMLLCSDNSKLRFAQMAGPIRDSIRGRAAVLQPNTLLAVYRISNSVLANPPVLPFGGRWTPVGDSGAVNLGENMQDLEALPFPETAKVRRIIALVSEDSEPPTKLDKVELNAILVQIVNYREAGNAEPTISPNISPKKFERWAKRCLQSGGRFVYLPLPTPDGQREPGENVFQRLVASALADLLIPTPVYVPQNPPPAAVGDSNPNGQAGLRPSPAPSATTPNNPSPERTNK